MGGFYWVWWTRDDAWQLAQVEVAPSSLSSLPSSCVVDGELPPALNGVSAWLRLRWVAAQLASSMAASSCSPWRGRVGPCLSTSGWCSRCRATAGEVGRCAG